MDQEISDCYAYGVSHTDFANCRYEKITNCNIIIEGISHEISPLCSGITFQHFKAEKTYKCLLSPMHVSLHYAFSWTSSRNLKFSSKSLNFQPDAESSMISNDFIAKFL